MKHVLIVMTGLLAAVVAEEGGLRMAEAQSPEEARAELEVFKGTYSDLAGWEKRKEAIREGILKGAGLEVLPERTPLKPKFSNKRVYEGYSAESVAFQSAPGFM